MKGIGPKKRTNTQRSFCRPSIRNGAVFPQKQKVKCRKKRTYHSQNGKTRPRTERENHSGTKGNDSGRTDGVHRHRNKSVFPLSEKVRARLAKEADLPAESICADRDLEKMVKSETVSQNLPAAVKAEFEKAIATYKQIRYQTSDDRSGRQKGNSC